MSTSEQLREAFSASGDIYRQHSANKIFKLGEEGSGTRSLGEIQDFDELRRECLSMGILFEDPEFPARDSSIYAKYKPPKYTKEFEWKRPQEITKSGDVPLFAEGFSRFDVIQGSVGDCWFMAGLANLAMHPQSFVQVVPEGQSFQKHHYAGIFHFRFWQYGRWVDVVVDDRLPVFNGRLLLARSPKNNKFWSSLLEKAYAKLHGSYDALDRGTLDEVITDFTGRIAETYIVDEMSADFFAFLLEAQEKGAIMGCAGLKEEVKGLCDGHEYSITRVDYVRYADKQHNPNQLEDIPLVRLRNPGGGHSVHLEWLNFVMKKGEWKGPWGDKSTEWNFVSVDEKKRLDFKRALDGEFWMSFQDFKRYFRLLQICPSNPNALIDNSSNDDNEVLQLRAFKGQWICGVSAGGHDHESAVFWQNPQYCITLESQTKGADDKCTVVISLKQIRLRGSMGVRYLNIGFSIYHLKDPSRSPKPLDSNFGKNNKPLDFEFHKENMAMPASRPFVSNEASCRVELPPGAYCIIPSTLWDNEEGEFLLRVFSGETFNMEEYDQRVCFGKIDDRVLEQNAQLRKNEEALLTSFRKHDGDGVDSKKLKAILDSVFCREMPERDFSEDVCRSIVELLDTDRSGRLWSKEIDILCKDIAVWLVVFSLYDTDGSGSLSQFQLKEALKSAGFFLNHHFLKILVPLYENDGQTTFADYILCALQVKTSLTSGRS